MEVIPKKVEYYQTPDGWESFREWFYSVRDNRAQNAIRERLTRMELGLLYELRIDLGPGYRVYFRQIGRTLVLLLCGGDKSTQDKDIKTARLYWEDHWRRNEG